MPTKAFLKLKDREYQVQWRTVLADDQTGLAQAEAHYKMYNKYVELLGNIAPNMEQLKGMIKGLGMAREIVGQHKVIWKEQAHQEKISVKQAKVRIKHLSNYQLSVKDSEQKFKDELERLIGKTQAIANAANDTLGEIVLLVEDWKARKDVDADFLVGDDDDPNEEMNHPDAEPEFLVKDEAPSPEIVTTGNLAQVVAQAKATKKGDNGKPVVPDPDELDFKAAVGIIPDVAEQKRLARKGKKKRISSSR